MSAHIRVSSRSARGASMAMVAAVAFLLLIVGIAAFQLFIYLGSSRELRHTVDAAVLNISKRAVENKVSPGQLFMDCGDSTEQVGLMNINRVTGKAYLINANEDELMNKGWDQQGQGAQHALKTYEQFQNTNDSLFNILASQGSANPHFQQLAKGKPTKLLPTNNDVISGQQNQWGYAWSYRGEESNLMIDPGQLPATPSQPHLIQYGGKGPTYMQGYNPDKANNNQFCFTVFHQNEAPHLISDSAFTQAKAAVSGAINPIPNTFKNAGLINNSQVPLSASACAVANPMRTYTMAIPYSFMTVSVKNAANWIIQGSQYPPPTTYYPGTGTVWKIKNYNIKKPGQGIEDGYCSLGNEYKGNLYQAINCFSVHNDVMALMLQRVKQMCPFYTAQKLQSFLSAIPYGQGQELWYIFPVYGASDVDRTQPSLSFATDPNRLPPWLIGRAAGPEGKSVLIAQEGPITNGPNTPSSNIRKGPYTTDKHFTTEVGQVSWQAGTGAYDGQYYYALGNVSCNRTTQVTFTALP